MSQRLPAARGKRDANHEPIAQIYRAFGFYVVDTSALGFGIPDFLIALGSHMSFVEVKTDDGELNAAQKQFWNEWRGPAIILIRSESEAAAHAQAVRRKVFGQ